MKTWAIILIIALLIAVPVAYWLISPAFIVKEANEPAPVFVPEPTPEPAAAEPTVEPVIDTDAQPAEAKQPVEEVPELPDEPAPSPVLAKGELVEEAHEAYGEVLVFKGNPRVLRFEDYYTLNGPDLRIYLATDTEATDFVDLGDIKATKGSVNYEIPEDVDIEKYDTVLIWCRAFSKLFSYAELV